MSGIDVPLFPWDILNYDQVNNRKTRTIQDEYPIHIVGKLNYDTIRNIMFEVRINDSIPIDTSQIEIVKLSGDSFAATFFIPITEGVNKVNIASVYNHRFNDFNVYIQKVDSIIGFQSLFYFGVGVSKYQDSSMNLLFADRDIVELGNIFLSQQGVLCDSAYCDTLCNFAATNDNVRSEMDRFMSDPGPGDGDLLIMCLSGHAIKGKADLFFMPTTGRINSTITGISIRQLYEYLSELSDKVKVLIFLDMCYAGANDKGWTPGQGNLTTFSSSTEDQKSKESIDYGGGHGCFVSALLTGLRGGADNIKENGEVTLSELINYVSANVPVLCSTQIPNWKSNNFIDYPLVRIAK